MPTLTEADSDAANCGNGSGDAKGEQAEAARSPPLVTVASPDRLVHLNILPD